MDQIDINKLWQNFLDTVTNHYTDFSGRVGRAQFWYYILVYVVVGIGVSIIGSLVGSGALAGALYGLALLLPSVGVTARRLQDTGRAGTIAWLWAIPVAVRVLDGFLWIMTIATLGLGLLFFAPLMGLFSLIALAAMVVLIYFCVQPGTVGPNEYGPPPAPWTPGSPVTPTAPPVT
jgi:uncharacterized membrane protein YhaH (DUF805 family)